jgi:phage shock protein C
MQTSKKLYRSRKDRIISGVCAGLGDFFNMDPTVVRVIFVLGMILGFGSFAFIYLVMIFVVPEEPEVSP